VEIELTESHILVYEAHSNLIILYKTKEMIKVRHWKFKRLVTITDWLTVLDYIALVHKIYPINKFSK